MEPLQGQTISTGHPTGHIVNPTGLLARKYRSGVTSARPGLPQLFHYLDRPGLTHTRPVSELLSVLLYNRPGFPSTRSVLLLRYSRRTSKCHNRPGFSMSRPVLIYRHYHFFFQQFFRPNSFAMLASPAHSITCSHFANGGISGTGSFPYPCF